MAAASRGATAVTAVVAPPTGEVLRFTGCAQFRQRIAMSILSQKRIRIDGIRDKDETPGLKDFEAGFLRLVDKLTNGSKFEINETGTSLRFQPGFVVGGSLEHDCGRSRSIGWFIEGILPILPFGKKASSIAFTGITNDDADFTVDTLRTVVFPNLSHFGFGEGLSVTVKKRGVPPEGGGLCLFTCPTVRELKPINLCEEGYVKKVRGVAFSCKVSPQLSNRLVDSSR